MKFTVLVFLVASSLAAHADMFFMQCSNAGKKAQKITIALTANAGINQEAVVDAKVEGILVLPSGNRAQLEGSCGGSTPKGIAMYDLKSSDGSGYNLSIDGIGPEGQVAEGQMATLTDSKGKKIEFTLCD